MTTKFLPISLALLGVVPLLGCDGGTTLVDAGPDIVARGVFADLANAPILTCHDARFTVSFRGLDSQPASAFSYALSRDLGTDGGITAEDPASNTCFEEVPGPTGSTSYRVCVQDLMPAANYVLRVRVGFDGGISQPTFRFGTPSCNDDASVE